ncbi:ABC transporter substrate-binding protein [Devosia sp. XGJD_8]|uniref:ABC transporter substrate-binding protein n=1 Tax=Devosia sp. XGJD_8 TaxID=3391187 RepID=UPI003984E7FC
MKIMQFARNAASTRTIRAAALAMTLLGTSGLTGVNSLAFAQADAEAVSGGEMTIIAGSDIKSWDPAITSGTFPGGPMDQLDAVYGFLVYVDLEGKVQGGMAESLTSEDATVWTLKLRPDVKFTDGNPYDAEAVLYNWKRAADPETLAPAQPFVSSWIDGAKVIDPLTIEITLPTPNRNFGSTLAQSAPFVASPAALEAAGDDKAAIKPVGAGAFIFEDWDQGISLSFKKNPDYWDQPRPYLDTLKFAIIPETNSRISTVVQGGAQMMAGYPYQFGANADAPGIATHEIPIPGLYRAYFNQVAGTFTDHRAREAFYRAVDPARLMQAYTQLEGYVTPTNYFTQASPYYEPAEVLPTYDPAKAQELFDALAADGKPFKIKLVSYTNSDLKRLTSYLQQVLTAYENVEVEVELVDQAMLKPQCQTQVNFDLCIDGGVLVANGAEPIISNMLKTGGVDNWGQYSSEAMDGYLDAANATMDQTEVKAAYADVQKVIAEDLPLYIFGSETRYLLLRDNAGGIVPSNGGILQKQYLYLCEDACAAE